MKVLGFIILGLIAIIAGGILYLQFAFPKVDPAPSITITNTPALIERGEYLAHHVSVCIDCHSSHDWTAFSAPPVPGTYGKGGDKFDKSMGFPGTFYAKNITSDPETGIGNWTDGEIYRTIISGVNKNGDPLFPIMPYQSYRHMTQEDLYAIIAYIRTLPPIKNKVPESDPDFPFSLILITMPSNVTEPGEPVLDTDEAKGEYLVTIAGCRDCHTPRETEGKYLAGGSEFNMPNHSVLRSANLTPDQETGIGNWTEEIFVKRFKMHEGETSGTKIGPNDFNTIMPWKMYAGMTEEDLKAIYRYLRTIPPIKNEIVKYTPPADEAEKN